MTMTMLQILIWGLQINFSEEAKFENTESTNNKDQLYICQARKTEYILFSSSLA